MIVCLFTFFLFFSPFFSLFSLLEKIVLAYLSRRLAGNGLLEPKYGNCVVETRKLCLADEGKI